MQPPFRVLVVDPPWLFSDKLTMDPVKRGSQSQYPTLTVNELAKLPVAELADDGSVLVLWCPAAILTKGFEVMASWGFTYKQQWNWVKIGKRLQPWQRQGLQTALDAGDVQGIADHLPMFFGMGRLARAAKEIALVGTCGSPYKHLENNSIRDTFFAPNLGHSSKPECVQDALDLMFPQGNKLELFARRDRPGWLTLGNECPSTEGQDIRDNLKELLDA